MRVSDQRMYSTLAAQVSHGREQLLEVQQQLATGMRINRPSDDPVASAMIGEADATLSRLAEHERASATAQSLLQAAEGSLSQVSDQLIRARELAVQGASEQYDDAGRLDMAREVRGMLDQLLALATPRWPGAACSPAT
jgi:flagellar hook-associated protein 3 FlgL